MALLPHHRDLLAVISDDVLDELGVYSAETDFDLPPAFRGWEKAPTPAIVFPWVGAGGEMVVQVRPDEPADDESKYVTVAGSVMPLGVHPRMDDRVADPQVPLMLCEGTKQYLAATTALLDQPWAVVGITGCYGWCHEGIPVPDFQAVPWEGREVVLCFDADWSTNRDVWEAARSLTTALEVFGAAKVRYARLPARGTAGLDDFLKTVSNRTAATERLLAHASGGLGQAPARKKKSKASPFMGDAGLQVESLAAEIRRRSPLALARDGTIAVYREGVFRTGTLVLGETVVELLGDDFRRMHLKDTEAFLAHQLSAEGRELPETAQEPIVNVRNGMLHLLTGELAPHDPAHLSSIQLPVEYDPAAKCPRYEAWLADQVGEGQIDDLEEVASTMLDRSRTPSKSMFLFGPSRSGKSTYLRLMEAVAGPENVSAVTLHQLSDDHFAAASLYGKMLNAAADLSAAHVNDLSLFKMLTGADLIYGNRKYGQTFHFRNTALFAFSANTIPTVGEASTAYLERIKPFEFPRSFAGFEDPGVEEAMVDELPGIFLRWVRAYQRLRARGGHSVTDPVVKRLFEEASDRVLRWVSGEMTIVPVASPGAVVEPGSALTRTELLRLFNQAAERDGEAKMGLKKFGEHALSIRGVHEVRRLPSKVRALNIVPFREDGNGGDGPVAAVAKPNPIPLYARSDNFQEGSGTLPYEQDGKFPPPSPLGHRHPDVAADLDRALRALGRMGAGDRLAVDVEATGVRPYQGDTIMGLVLAWDGEPPAYLPIAQAPSGCPDLELADVARLIEALNACPATQIFHNGTYDIAMLERCLPGYQVPFDGRYDDTLVRAWLIDERQGKSKGLKTLCREAFGAEYVAYAAELDRILDTHARAQRKAGVRGIGRGDCYRFLTYDEEAPYGKGDGTATLDLHRHQENLLDTSRIALPRELAVQAVLYDLTKVGVAVDLGRAEQCRQEAEAAFDRAREAFGGADVMNDNVLRRLLFEDWGIDPPRLTKKGAASVDKVALALLAERESRVRLVLQAREIKKQVDLFASLEAAIGSDGRVHSNIWSTRTDTGRLSSSDPALMNIPKNAGGVIVAGPGLELVRLDIKSEEMVILASLSGDPALVEALSDPSRNVHCETALSMFGVGDKDTPEYKLAKVFNFGIAYGMGQPEVAGRLAESRSVAKTPEIEVEARELLRKHRELYPVLWSWDGENRKLVNDQGFITSSYWPGRIKHYLAEDRPERQFNGGRFKALHTASNFLVQGGAGEFLKDLLMHLHAGDFPFRVVLPIHDELVIECEPGGSDEVLANVQKASDEVNPFSMRLVWEKKEAEG